MRILQIVHDYLPEHVGGTEVHAHRLARALAARGHELTSAFTERDPARAAWTQRRGELDGLATIEIVHPREYARLEDSWLEPEMLATFESLVRELRPDVVHFQHTVAWGPACIGAARAAGCATVATLHDFHWLCDNARAARDDGTLCLGADGLAPPECEACLVERFGSRARGLGAERRRIHVEMLARAHALVCPSRFLARALACHARIDAERVYVIAPGTLGERRAARRTPSSEPLRVGFVGGLFPAKGAHVALAALRLVRGERIEFHVHGVLEWFPDYVERLRALALGANVHFHGRFAPDDVGSVLDALDLLVVPSLWYENAPLVIQDAFRRGVPVIASDIGGLREALAGGGGSTFPAGDAAALAELLGELARDRARLFELARGVPRTTPIEHVAESIDALFSAAVAAAR